ncbi:hypothetical protein OAU50_01045 [Planctomycetota bacterium]|nr:hypothetical protein [Planctomycetota bacterium]
MKTALSIALLALFQLSVIAQDEPTPESKDEPKASEESKQDDEAKKAEQEAAEKAAKLAQKAESALKLIDEDADGNATFDEFKARQKAYYEAAKKVKKKIDELAKVVDAYTDLLTTQQFLAADKDDDSSVTKEEITFLLENPRHELDLKESDVDLMVEDWMLRYKLKCPSLYYTDEWHESKIQKRYKHLKREVSKEELRARPFREAVVGSVLTARRRDAFAREFTWAQWSSVFKKPGLRFKFGSEFYVSANEKQLPPELKDKVKSIWAPEKEVQGREYLKFNDSGLKFEYTADERTGYSKAGKIDSHYIEIRFGQHVLKTWRHKAYPFIPVVVNETIFGDEQIRTLESLTEPK